MKKLNSIILILTTLFICYNLNANDTKKMPLNLGVYIGGNVNLHNANYYLATPNGVNGGGYFQDLKPFISEYGNQTSLGLNGGFIINVPIDEMFVFSGRLGLFGAGANFNANYVSPFAALQTFDSLYNDEFNSSLLFGELNLMMQFHNLLPIQDMYLLAGFDLGFPINANVDRNENTNLRDPNGNILSTETRSNSFDIPDASMRMALAIGAGYVIEVDKDLFISPELSFRFGLNDISSNTEFSPWSMSQIRFGVNITFGFSDEEIPEEVSSMKVGFDDVRAYDNNGDFYTVDKIRVEEVQYSELYPLVPYIFTDENSKYPTASEQILSAESETGKFDLLTLNADALDINKNLLDIIGTRMKDNTRADLTIVGTRDSKGEKNNKQLSSDRAEFAKNYLVVNYGISPDRIKTIAKDRPDKPSSDRTEDGIIENRRIEFYSNDPAILYPVLIEKEKQSVATPNQIEFVTYSESTDPIKSWELELLQSGKSIKSFKGDGAPSNIQWTIQPNQLAASELPLEYSLFVENDKGIKETETGTISVEYISSSRQSIEEKPDKSVSKFSLVVFDFDSPKISDIDKKIIDEQILQAIKYNSTVQIYGYTDRIGNEDYNKKLALNRAKNVRDYLSSKAKSAKYEVYGIGESILPYDNDSPVGRQLSRTVQIYVITPKE